MYVCMCVCPCVRMLVNVVSIMCVFVRVYEGQCDVCECVYIIYVHCAHV